MQSNFALTKHARTKDGIKVWDEWMKAYFHEGSFQNRIINLEAELHRQYNPNYHMDVVTFIDKFTSYVFELEGLYQKEVTTGLVADHDKTTISDRQKCTYLLMGLSNVQELAPTVQYFRTVAPSTKFSDVAFKV